MATLSRLFVELGLRDNMSGALDKSASKVQKTAGAFKKIGVGFSQAFTGPAIAAGAALFKIGSDFDSMSDTIRIGTGATGAALKGLEQDALAVFKTIPTTMDLAGQAISELKSRTGATGVVLQDLARTELELARITGGDLGAQITNTTRLFGDWGIAVEDQVSALDKLFRASQATGIGVDQLSALMVQFGAPLRQLGFSFDQTAALLGKFEKEGVNTELVMGSLRIALGKMAKEGVADPVEALGLLVNQIKNAGSAGEANALALEMFGARAGPDMAAAIREGRFDVEDLFGIIANGEDTILGAAAATNDWKENLQILRNRIAVALLPIANKLFAFINEKGVPFVEKLTAKFEKLVQWFDKLSPKGKLIIGIIIGIAAAIGPVLIVLGTLIGAIAPAIGVIGAILGAISLPLLLIIGLVALLAVAWIKDWGGIREKTAAAIGFIGKWLGKLWAFVQPAIDVIKLLGEYFHDVMTNKIQPGNLAKLPKWLQPIAWVLGRIIKTVRVFIKTWQDKGLVAALKTIPMQIRAFGRAVANLFEKMGLKRFAQAVKETFYDVARLFTHVVELVDDLVHGRWKEVWGDLKNIAVDIFWLFIDRFKMGIALFRDLWDLIPWGTIGSALWTGLQIAVGFLVTTGLPWLLTKGAELIGGLLTAFSTFWDETLAPWLAELPGKIAGGLGDVGETLASKGRQLMRGLWHAARDYWDETVYPWVKGIPGKIGGVFDGLFNYGFNAGWSLIAGLSAGIQSIWNTLVGWIDSIIGQFDRIPDWLKPGSPSKTMTIFGKSAPWGLAVGIQKGMPMLKKAAGQMAGAFGMAGSGSATVGTPRLAAMPAVAGAGSGNGVGTAGNRTLNIHQGAIVVQDSSNPGRTAKIIVREIEKIMAGAV